MNPDKITIKPAKELDPVNVLEKIRDHNGKYGAAEALNMSDKSSRLNNCIQQLLENNYIERVHASAQYTLTPKGRDSIESGELV